MGKVIDVYIKHVTGKTTTLYMPANETIKDVCIKIAKEEGISANCIQLKYTGKVLNPLHTLEYLGVCAETILKCEVIQEREWTVYVKCPEGSTVPTKIKNTCSIGEIKKCIEEQKGHSVKSQVLKLANQTLKDTDIARNVGITEESTIKLEFKKVTAKSKSESANATADELEEQENLVDKDVIINSFSSAGRRVEVAFSFDTTGSMYSCLNQVRTNLRTTVERLLSEVPGIRIAMIAHGDYCDYNTYVLRYVDLTTDVDALVNFVNDVPSTGGGDAPECYEWVLRKSQFLDWSEDSAKALVVIGDCEPHAPLYTDQKINWHDELELLTGMGVKVYGVRALSNLYADPFYKELSDRSGGAYVNFKNFEIITEMFLAVCYREASADQYDRFCEEFLSDEHIANSTNNDVKEVIEQLNSQATAVPVQQTVRYVAAAWWDPSLESSGRTPQYSYDPDTDTWGPYPKTKKFTSKMEEKESPPAAITDTVISRNNNNRKSMKRRLRPKLQKCSLM